MVSTGWHGRGPAIHALLLIPLFVFAQTELNKKSAANEPLSKAQDCGGLDFRLFKDDPQKVMFHLTTSWIAGEKRQGMLRYKMVVFVPKSITADPLTTGTTSTTDAAILKRVSQCMISPELHDKDDFVLRVHVMPFKNVVDEENAQLTSLLSNDAFQLSAQEYRQFLGGGLWTISWSC